MPTRRRPRADHSDMRPRATALRCSVRRA